MACVAEIQRRAQEALVNCPVAELRRLEVVFEGVCLEDQSLLISGTVSSFYYKQLAEEVVTISGFCASRAKGGSHE